MALAEEAGPAVGMELVALCDAAAPGLGEAGRRFDAATYTAVDRFLEHDMDAVILANSFHQHAPLAIKALEAGKHVLSETSACMTLAEGVALTRAVTRSGLVYMLAENFPYRAANQELRRLFLQGAVGRFLYGEGEYVHPLDAAQFNSYAPAVEHWRNWLPFLYYCTHALAPVLFVTGARPLSVSGFVVPWRRDDPGIQGTARRSDPVGLLVLQTDDGALIKALQGTMHGESVTTRISGTAGAMESLRHRDAETLWVASGDQGKRERTYVAELPGIGQVRAPSGHGGSDRFVHHHFVTAIRRGQPPFLDVHRAVAMSVAGILGYRSALSGSASLAIPDLSDQAEQARHESDDWSPDPAHRRPGQPAPSIRGDVTVAPEDLAAARQAWAASAPDDHARASADR